MSDDLQAQLHVTAWPGVPLQLPDTYRVSSRLDVEAGVIVPCPQGRYGEDWKEEAVALDGETYLRLIALDLEDPEAIFAFVGKHGPLGGEELYRTFTQAVVGYRFKNLYGPRLNQEVEDRKKKRALLRDAATRMPRLVERDMASMLRSNFPSYALRLLYTETLEEFRFAARFLGDLTAAWRMLKEGKPASEVPWVAPHPGIDPELLQEDAFPLFLLGDFLPEFFLRPYSPHLSFRWSPPLAAGPISDLPARRGGTGIEPVRRPISGRLYQICALELFNHIVTDADYLICGNENCAQKLFVHQQGGAPKRYYRSKGVMYCSSACGHAVAQREYRRRRKRRRADQGQA
jgi:hypothetical protein